MSEIKYLILNNTIVISKDDKTYVIDKSNARYGQILDAINKGNLTGAMNKADLSEEIANCIADWMLE